MSGDSVVIEQLLDRWETLCADGAEPSVAELCQAHPHLTEQIGKKIAALREMNAVMEIDEELSEPATVGGQRPEIPGYEMLGRLGWGGMGVVWKARHAALNRVVAVKFIAADFGANPRDRSRFQAEAEALARVPNRHIVQIYDVGERQGRPYFTMEFVDGEILARKTGMPWKPNEAAELVEKIARAVHAAHKQGIVHRDLKPANVIIASDGTPKVTDFGLAKYVDEKTAEASDGAIVGTPNYMAPEQAAGDTEAIGPATDVYGLGGILYELLTGRPPFQEKSSPETLLKVIREEPEHVRRWQPSVACDLEAVCMKCLEKEVDQRYDSALWLAEDLRRYLEGRPTHARPVTLFRRAGMWSWRNPLLVTLLIFMVMMALSALASLTWLWRDAVGARDEMLQEKARADRNFSWARRTVEETTAKLLQNPHFRQSPELRELQEEMLTLALSFYEEVARQQTGDSWLEAERGRAYWALAVVRSTQKEYEQALADAEQMEAVYGRLTEKSRQNSDYRFRWGWSFGWKAILLRDLKRPEEAARNCAKAIEVLEEVVAKHPDHTGALVKLGATYMHSGSLTEDRGQIEDAFRWYGRSIEILEAAPADGGDTITDRDYFLRMAYDKHAQAAAQLEQWEVAVISFAKLVQSRPAEPYLRYELAVAELGAGNHGGYRRACAEMLDRFESTRDPETAERIVYTCAAGEKPIAEASRLLALARMAAVLGAGNARLLGAISYRSGDYAQALEYFKKTAEAQELRPWDWLFQAMSYHQLGKTDEAEDRLKRAISWIDQATKADADSHPVWGWTEKIESSVLRREAEALMRGTLEDQSVARYQVAD